MCRENTQSKITLFITLKAFCLWIPSWKPCCLWAGLDYMELQGLLLLSYRPNRHDETPPRSSLATFPFTCVLIFSTNIIPVWRRGRESQTQRKESYFASLKPRANFLKMKEKKFSQISVLTFFLLYSYLNTYKYNMKYKLLAVSIWKSKFTNKIQAKP